MTDTSQPLFLFGPGYCATVLAAIWDGRVVAVTRSETGASAAAESGMQVVSVRDAAGIQAASARAHVLISAPPGDSGCPAAPILGPVISEVASLTYVSTTGVYGDLAGGWAFEWSPVNPGQPRSVRRAQAERQWQALRPDLQIVRLPGIYGPGRSAFDRLRAGTARRVVKPGQVFSRAHVDDIASGLKALITARAPGVFHICDEEAAPPQDVTAYAAQLLGVEPPPEIAIEDAGLSAMAASFYAECKRVSNARLKAATGWRPTYPTYREGLAAILASEGA